MVRFTVLASGSRGNSTVVSSSRTRILVDAGLSCREFFRRMKLAGEEPEKLDAIVITHEHQDHINGLAATARKLGIPVYFTEGTHRAWMRWLVPRRQMTYALWLEQRRRQAAPGPEAEPENEEFEQKFAENCEPVDARKPAENAAVAADSAPDAAATEAIAPDGEAAAVTDPAAGDGKKASPADDPTWLPAVEYFQSGQPFEIGDIAVSPFTISHDAADPVGYVFHVDGARVAVATDLGYVSPNVKAQLKGADILLLESNHDLEMLRNGPYPWSVKQRVLSRVGHLSNQATADFLESGYDGQAVYVILAHLSENNNLPELARVAAERALCGRASLLANKLLLAEQHQPLSSLFL